MCGICGIVAGEGRDVPQDTIARMNHVLVHRGPDEEGYYDEDGVGLGMRRLKVIDLDTGRQPIQNEDRSVTVVLNGEIYNYRELREYLLGKGHRFYTRSDTEVLVHLYEEEGIGFLKRLRGMFGIALWDGRERALFLIRDRLGIKPLYYAHINGRLIFASEIKSILASGLLPKEIDWEAFDAYFTYNYIPAPLTIYRNIYQLPPGHLLRWSGGDMEIRRYWTLDFSSAIPVGEAELEEQLEGLLSSSLRYHLVSDVPLGIFLSGGIDSSALVAFAREAKTDGLKTFSLGFDVKGYDESRYARRVASHFDTDHTEFRVKPDMLHLLPRLVWHLDQPFADDSILPTYLVSRLAKGYVTVALSGDGGDELFGGYAWTRRYQYTRMFQRLPRFVRMPLLRLCMDETTRHYRASGRLQALRRFLYDSSLSMREGFDRRTATSPFFRRHLYSDGVRSEIKDFDAIRIRDCAFSEQVKDEREWMLLADIHFYLPDDILFKVDRMSMANSLEARVPLLDHTLAEFAAKLPFDLKIRGTTTKYLLKKILKKRLPGEILRQRKQGFSLPVGHWFRGEARGLLRRMLSSDTAARFFNMPFLSWLVWEHQRGRQDVGQRLFSVLTFLLWHEIGLEHEMTEPPDGGIEGYLV